MKILLAFLVAAAIGACSRWAHIPSLAPQALVGSLLIVAMTSGYVVTDHLLSKQAVVSTKVAPAIDSNGPKR
jgi:XapX domain-containing protein